MRDLQSYSSRIVAAMRASAIGLWIVGAVGLGATFISYGRIGVLAFAGYLTLALVCIVLGVLLCVHTRTVKKVFKEIGTRPFLETGKNEHD